MRQRGKKADGFILGSVVSWPEVSWFSHGPEVFHRCWSLWLAGWWLERFPLQAPFSSSPVEGAGSCFTELTPWFISHRSCYQSPASLCQYFKPFGKLFLVEGRPWLAAQEFTLISSSLEQPDLLNRVVLSSWSHRSGIFFMCYKAGQKGTAMQMKNSMFLRLMDLPSLPDRVFSAHCLLTAHMFAPAEQPPMCYSAWNCGHLFCTPLSALTPQCWALTWELFSIMRWAVWQ